MKKITAILLILCFLCATSCAAQEKETAVTTSARVSESAVTTETPAIQPDLPKADYKGEKFNILLSCWSEKDMAATEETGDIMNDAVYKRNTKIEEQFNVKLNPIAITGAENDFGISLNAMRKSIQAGDDEYDVFFSIQGMAMIDAMDNQYMPWSELPYVDLSKPWWEKGILDVCFGDEVFFGTGDICYSTAGYTTLLLFNKNLFLDNAIPYPYEAVRNGTWTYDFFISTIKDLATDLNGDSKMNYKDDLYTIGGWRYEMPYNFHTSLLGNETIKNKDGYPEVDILSPQSVTAFEKTLDIFTKYGGFLNSHDYQDDQKMFQNGQLFFLDTRFFEVENFREMKDDFGMIPHPKLTEEQEGYIQLVNSNVATVVVVPVTNTKMEMTSVLLEALAYESSREVIPMYKEVLLRTKLTRDDESADMFDYIWSNRHFRYQLAVHSDVLMNLMLKKDYNLVSTYEKLDKKANKEIEKIKEVFFKK